MQHKSIFTCALIALISVLSIFATISCSNEETPTVSNETNALISKARRVGDMHNQLLNEVLTNLNGQSSRSGVQTLSDIHDYALSYIAQRSIATSSRSETVLSENQQIIRDLTAKEVPAIRQEMSVKEIEFVDRAIYSIEMQQQQAIDTLLIEAAESDLPTLHKEAVMNFLATLQASEIYWDGNEEDWVEYLRTNLSAEDFEAFQLDTNARASQIAFADAYYMWWGTLGSGCNITVGVCCGAFGSLCTFLNTK